MTLPQAAAAGRSSRGRGTGWRKARLAGAVAEDAGHEGGRRHTAEPSSSAPRVPVSPLATVSHVSTSRSRNGSKPLTSKRQAGSAVGSGKLR